MYVRVYLYIKLEQVDMKSCNESVGNNAALIREKSSSPRAHWHDGAPHYYAGPYTYNSEKKSMYVSSWPDIANLA